jgi:two-component system, OmpR family, sensor histidine kinase VanS
VSEAQALPARRSWHGSVRGRLAGATALLLTAFGVVVLGLVYLGMRFLPNYQISSAIRSTTALTPVTGGTTQLGTPIDGTAVTATPVTGGGVGLVISSPGSVVSTLLMIAAVVLAATVVLGAVAAWLLARRFLRPMEALARVSAAFGDGDLAHRAPSTGRDDEFGTVTSAFNAMLDRTERAMTINQRFAANASHELRSPLATTKTLLDVARQDPAAVELGPLLSKLSAANDRSITIVEALLDLADADRADIDVDTVDMAAAVAATVQEITAEAAGRGVTFHGHLARCEAAANLPLVRQAVGNLLSNAVRHNTEGGTVEIETGTVLTSTVLASTGLTDTGPTGTSPRDGWAQVRIRNTGPVIDPKIIQLLGEPFYRIRPRYRPAGQGDSHGLGLPIALAIAEALGGSLTLTANPEGGLTAELLLPASGPASPRALGGPAPNAQRSETRRHVAPPADIYRICGVQNR